MGNSLVVALLASKLFIANCQNETDEDGPMNDTMDDDDTMEDNTTTMMQDSDTMEDNTTTMMQDTTTMDEDTTMNDSTTEPDGSLASVNSCTLFGAVLATSWFLRK